MQNFLKEVRSPVSIPLSKKAVNSLVLLLAGSSFGVFSKMLDQTPSNELPYFLEMLDLGNFFSRIGIWLFLSVLISVYSKSPGRAMVNVFLFLAGMVGSYFLYTVFIAGFFPESYMMFWIIVTVFTPFLAYLCWYAKGRGIMGIGISSLIVMLLLRQAFSFGIWYFHLKSPLELLLLIAAVFVLYQSKRQIIKVVIIGLILRFLTADMYFFWGLL
ncbi:hypothetical protein [Jeotgalibacillus proteolyticus]|uniref:Uncharacterized protein n=1 Tax=Jeotgalibacillus proteolyticus TaxID=2082395 RepID=A0A2S5G831_9BACL|nr:hypothetical protein [Jeotgalibacillus proteolyticus]PPA69103.1 hypothetical protein C4B60_17480 [Jeotgalibacillus proteolyticus]